MKENDINNFIKKEEVSINIFELISVGLFILASSISGLTYLTGVVAYQIVCYSSFVFHFVAYIFAFICLFKSYYIIRKGYLAKTRYTYLYRFFIWLALWNFIELLIIGSLSIISASPPSFWSNTIPDIFASYVVTLSFLIHLLLAGIFFILEQILGKPILSKFI